jgi:hypothetical protein
MTGEYYELAAETTHLKPLPPPLEAAPPLRVSPPRGARTQPTFSSVTAASSWSTASSPFFMAASTSDPVSVASWLM